MNLRELYKLRKNFTIIGLTGRTGSGCTTIAELLSQDYSRLSSNIRAADKLGDPIIARKIDICRNYLSKKGNWIPFEIIKYKDVLLFYIIGCIDFRKREIYNLLDANYTHRGETDSKIIKELEEQIIEILKESSIAKEIAKLPNNYQEIKNADKLGKLNDLFWSDDFQILSKKIFRILEKPGYYKRTLFLHHISCNIRNSGFPINNEKIYEISNIYKVSELINRLIKARKQFNDSISKPTKIVIDSLRNSLEIMFFKERYSAFYMIAAKDATNNIRQRIAKRLPQTCNDIDRDIIVDKLIELDSIEYRTKDFSKGKFGSPDVGNCIQKSEIHIVKESIDINSDRGDLFTVEEQILKIVALIHQPGIITPSPRERCMQVAFNAKLNSGCISRQVGAVLADSNYSIKAVGWNDVPHGQTPCNLRNANDYVSQNGLDQVHYSSFERGVNIESNDIDYKYKNKTPGNFPQAMRDYYKHVDISDQNTELEGRNCSFCFKTIHNHYESEKNQVHTKSLHAEENAMLQITKYGGQAIYNGILFTTASPCELCSKKAMQLGIKTIFYIDPYPGIAIPQILEYNRSIEMKLVSFSGVIGKSYNKLYEPFMPYKDELSIILDNKIETVEVHIGLEIIERLKNIDLKKMLNEFLVDGALDEAKLLASLKNIKHQ